MWAEGTTWGSATLLRVGGLFDSHDPEYLAAIGPWAATASALALLRTAACRLQLIEEPPGIVEARSGGTVAALTAPGQRWIDEGGLLLVTAINVLAAAIRGQRNRPGDQPRGVLRRVRAFAPRRGDDLRR